MHRVGARRRKLGIIVRETIYIRVSALWNTNFVRNILISLSNIQPHEDHSLQNEVTIFKQGTSKMFEVSSYIQLPIGGNERLQRQATIY